MWCCNSLNAKGALNLTTDSITTVIKEGGGADVFINCIFYGRLRVPIHGNPAL